MELREGYPAYAGMDLEWSSYRDRGVGLPRLRGDGPYRRHPFFFSCWATPPTRGWTHSCSCVGSPYVGYPAYAGMDPRATSLRRSRERLPRLRGDGPIESYGQADADMATPPTRGWTHYRAGSRSDALGYPAYAGMDPGTTWRSRTSGRLPRLRGDGPEPKIDGPEELEATPPTRGWTTSRCRSPA